jgi:hypothetical protein
MDVATDPCVLINLAIVGRLDLLSLIPPFVFHASAEVLDEIEDPEQKTAVEQGIAAGVLNVVKLEDPNELASYVGFNAKPWGRETAPAWPWQRDAAGPLRRTSQKIRSGRK